MIILMTNRFYLTPVLSASIGAAVSFYFFHIMPPTLMPFFFFITAAISLIVLCFFRVLSMLYPQERKFHLIAVWSAALAIGLFFGVSAATVGRNNVRMGISADKVIAIEGVLREDPRIISGGRAMTVLSLRRVAGDSGLRVSAGGDVTVFFTEENALRLRDFGRGTTVYTEGRLRQGDSTPGVPVNWTFSAESMHIVKPASSIERMRTGIRLNLINRFDDKNWGGLALALLLGIRDNLDTNLASMYRNAGCSHILALSGMHLAVLAALIAFLLKKPLGLKPAAIAGAVIICLYCFIVGPMPSLNRAAIMYLLGVVTILGALPKEPVSILALSFLIQIAAAPAAGNSMSFILSYSALAGILVIGQRINSLFAGKVPNFLLMPFSASCGAFFATAGITAFAFNYIAPIVIIAGLFLVPLITVFMIGSMIWLVFDFISISFILDLPLSLLYRLMEIIISLAGRIPGITKANPFLILAVSVVLSLVIIIFEYRRRTALSNMETFA